LLDLGRAYYVYIALEDAANEAALYLAINPTCLADEPGPGPCDDPNNATFRAQNSGVQELDWSRPGAKITPSFPGGAAGAGLPVEVTVEYPFYIITPIIANMVNSNGIILTTTARHVIIAE
jgi:hypothetical protein